MVNRNELITKAQDFIRLQPNVGRRVIAKQLRTEFGRALRDSTILSLQRDIWPERRQVIVPPYQLAEPRHKMFKPVRQARYNKLVRANMTSVEARKLSLLPLTRLKPIIRQMKKSRSVLIKGILKEASFNNWSKSRTNKELSDLIDFTYKDLGWADLKGENNPYSMIRYFRKEAISDGDWDPADSPWRKKPRIRAKVYGSRWKGNTKAQKVKYRSLHKESIKEAKQLYRQRIRQKAGKG